MNIISFLKKIFKIETQKVYPEINNNDTEKVLINWICKPIDYYHWWPMKEKEENINDVYNNLYANGGGLSKYDNLFCTKGIEYQKNKYFRKYNSKKDDANWAGFCDCATILGALWKHPLYPVKVIYNGKVEIFNVCDIEALMIIASYNTVCPGKNIFLGRRFNGDRSDNKDEPYPIHLIDMLFKVCNDKLPFAIDIDNGTAVWNYPYNNVKVIEYNYLPKNNKYINLNNIPLTGKTKYYNFIIKSNAYFKQNLNIWGWSNNTLNIITQGWLSDKHPDFIWKTFPKKLEWTGQCKLNSEVNAIHIYKIYKASFKQNIVVVL